MARRNVPSKLPVEVDAYIWHFGTVSREGPVSHPRRLPAPGAGRARGLEGFGQQRHRGRTQVDHFGSGAWKAVSGIGLAAGLPGKYHRFALDEAVLDGGYAARISGGPTMGLQTGLLKLSAQCQKERQSGGRETAPARRNEAAPSGGSGHPATDKYRNY